MLRQEKIVNIGDVCIGKGMPKLCVPIHGTTEAEVYERAEYIAKLGVDLAEWRVDFFSVALSNDKLNKILAGLKERLNCPLILTLRTANEGGARSISDEYYLNINRGALNSGLIDIIDIELYFNKKLLEELTELAKLRKVPLLLSNHDTQKTPEKDEIVRRFLKMEKMGADIAKVAVMPKTKQDVLCLMEAAVEARETAEIPLIAISMGREGLISRIAGEFTGSCVAYAARSIENHLGQATAEDQMQMLSLVHKYSNIVK